MAGFAVLERYRHANRCLCASGDVVGKVVAIARQHLEQRPIQRIPGGEAVVGGGLIDNGAGLVHVAPVGERQRHVGGTGLACSQGRTPLGEVALGHRQHDDARASAFQRAGGALVDMYVVAELMEQDARGQPADGPAGDSNLERVDPRRCHAAVPRRSSAIGLAKNKRRTMAVHSDDERKATRSQTSIGWGRSEN